MTGVDMPVTAERFPGLLVDGRHVRRDPGVEDDQTGTVFADHVLRKRFVGGIGGDRCEDLAEFVAYRAQFLLVAGDADDGLEGIGYRTLRSGGRVRSASRPAAGGKPVAAAEIRAVMWVTARRPAHAVTSHQGRATPG
jgi:hypothetical protein